MTKLGDDGRPTYRQDGKVLRGPNFCPPDLMPILTAAGYQKSNPEVSAC